MSILVSILVLCKENCSMTYVLWTTYQNNWIAEKENIIVQTNFSKILIKDGYMPCIVVVPMMRARCLQWLMSLFEALYMMRIEKTKATIT